MPFPKEETTPPVTKMNLVSIRKCPSHIWD
jgi:hypothetical protein